MESSTAPSFLSLKHIIILVTSWHWKVWLCRKSSGWSVKSHKLTLLCFYTAWSCNYFCSLQPPEPETPEVILNEIYKTPEPQEWTSLGSEQEIDEESIKQTREKVLQYVKMHKIFILNLTFSHSPLPLYHTSFFCLLFFISCSTSSPECVGSLVHQSLFQTAILQMLRMVTWSVLPIKTAYSASSRCRGTAGCRLFPDFGAAVLRHSGTVCLQMMTHKIDLFYKERKSN